ncbi:MAG: Asp-tRNA(Asn)/Glu-tRNA(Gln) amidotransferase subunit GatA [Candidatus Taylorbacteria bacterium]|nr:Asp-tRNA(Asn)/Glu-tRNA(Gln) amidotransferase subunit GatA [Candidatus Taylorbacteria bacterium]
MHIDLTKLTIETAHEHLMKGDFTAVELAKAYLDEIGKKNKELNAYLEVFDDVLEQAALADTKIKEGKAQMLTGIPLGVKDNILIKGRHASAASKILEGYVASYDATAIQKLKEAGAVFLGRTNMDEFAMGSSTETSAYGISKNPLDPTRVPGGSSGGSAVVVASHMALAALGSDTAGSVRQPASFCGVVGFKPTYGGVSRHGLMAMGSSLDVIGTITKNISDARHLFSVIKGRDALDSTSIDIDMKSSKKRSGPLRVGVPKGFVGEGVDADVLENFKQSLERLKKNGAEIKEIELTLLPYSLPVYYTIIPAEVSTNLARFDGVKYGAYESGDTLLADYFKTRARFGPEARRRIFLGAYVLSAGYADAYYRKAITVREMVRKEMFGAFEGEQGVDIIATPTVPTPAFKIGEKIADPISMYLADIFTVIANIAGIPAISIPSGFVERDGVQLPLGLQFMAPAGGEQLFFEIEKYL